MSEISQAIEKITHKYPAIEARLREIISHKKISCGGTQLHCYCLKTDCRNQIRETDFVNFLLDCIVDYVISNKERNSAIREGKKNCSFSPYMKLDRRAKDLFTLQEKSGEVGELILFILANHYLRYPILINKMSLKTSPDMHVHGSDGIHFNFDEESGILDLYWGESKVYKDVNGALDDCLASIRDFILESIHERAKRSIDLNLIGSNLGKLDSDVLEQLLLPFFNLDSDFSNRVRFKGICFVGFNSDKNYIPFDFKDLPEVYFHEHIEEWENKLKKKLIKHNLDSSELHVFMIPFESVERLRDKFREGLKR